MAELLPEIARLSAALEKDPNSRLFLPLAEEYIKASMLEEAIQILTDGLTRHADFVPARVSLGKVYVAQSKFVEAQKEFEHVLQKHPDNLIVLKQLATIYRQQGQWAQVKKCCLALLMANSKDAEAEKLLKEAEAAASKGSRPGMVDLSPETTGQLTSGLSNDSAVNAPPPAPPRNDTVIELGGVLTGLDDSAIEIVSSPSAAPTEEEEAKPKTPPPPPPKAERAVAAPADQDADEAPEELVSPTLAQLYMRQGHYEQAIRVYDELLRREPTNESYRKAHEMALALMGQSSQPAAETSAAPPTEPARGSVSPASAPPQPGNAAAVGRLQGWLGRIQQRRRVS